MDRNEIQNCQDRVEYLLTRFDFNLLNCQDKLGRPRPDLPNLQTLAGRSKWCFNVS
jgi:hypothetical protein